MNKVPFDDQSLRPAGVTTVAVAYFLAVAYLCVVGAGMLVAPGSLSMALGAPLLGGLEVAGPYMFLLMGGVGLLIGWGLLRLNAWARRAAIVAAIAGFAMLMPSFTMALVNPRPGRLFVIGAGVLVRMLIAWYLWQQPVAEHFIRKRPATD